MAQGKLIQERPKACLAALAVASVALLARARLAQHCQAAEWVDTRVAGPFLCRADFPLDGIDPVLADLTQLQSDLMRDLGIPPTQEWIELYLFADQTTYRAYLASRLPQVPYRRALYVKLEGPGMVFAYRSRELAVDLRHECMHALLHAVLPMVPLWLDEGLAEYYELPPNARVFDNPYLSSVRWSARFGIMPNLETLEKKGDLSEMGRTEYRAAWAWAHYMIHGPPAAHEELVRFLADIRAGTPPGQLSYRLQRRIGNLRADFCAHFKNWSR